MNKTKIEWCDMTWNPITGCLHGCEYCYARRIANRFGRSFEAIMFENAIEESDRLFEVDEKDAKYPYPFAFKPTFHTYRLNEPKMKTRSRTIFVCSMADLFGDWVPEEWILKVFDACKAAPQHKYLFLTKNPKRYLELEKKRLLPWEDNFWFGISVTKPDDELAWFRGKKFHWFVSMEPLLEGIDITTGAGVIVPEWVIIGAETGNRKGKIVPEREWLSKIVEDCRTYNIPVFMKNSLKPIWGKDIIAEYPW
jgi:protein gp37